MLDDPYIQDLLKEANLSNREREYIRILMHKYNQFPNRPTYNEIVYRLLTSQRKETFLDKVKSLFKSKTQISPSLLEEGVFQDIIGKIEDSKVKSYLIEAGKCYSVEAYCACVIMLWTTIIYHFHMKIDQLGFHIQKETIKNRFPSNKEYMKINHKNKLHNLKDRDLLIILQDLNIIDLNIRKLLEKHLDLRNSCAHPNLYKISRSVVEAYIDDLINNVLLL